MVYQIVRTMPLNMLDDASGSATVASTPLLLSILRMVHPNNQTVSMLAILASNMQVLVTTIDISTTKPTYRYAVESDVFRLYWQSIASICVDNI